MQHILLSAVCKVCKYCNGAERKCLLNVCKRDITLLSVSVSLFFATAAPVQYTYITHTVTTDFRSTYKHCTRFLNLCSIIIRLWYEESLISCHSTYSNDCTIVDTIICKRVVVVLRVSAFSAVFREAIDKEEYNAC